MLRKLIYEAGARMRNPSLMEQFDFLKKSDRWERAQLDYYQLEKMKSFLEFAYLYSPFYRTMFKEIGFVPSQMTSLKEMKVKDMTLDFTIKDGRVETQPFDIKMGDYNLNLSGSTGLDQTIDYTGKIKLPASAGNISKMMTLDLKIGGSFTSPKVSVDTKSMANQAVEAVANEAISKLGEKLGLDSATTANKDSIKQKVTEKAAEKALELLKKIK